MRLTASDRVQVSHVPDDVCPRPIYTLLCDRFVPGMVDSLNAEISLGTIRNMQEAIEWLGYTYLFGKR
jgi:hypothetical protein